MSPFQGFFECQTIQWISVVPRALLAYISPRLQTTDPDTPSRTLHIRRSLTCTARKRMGRPGRVPSARYHADKSVNFHAGHSQEMYIKG